MPSLPGKKTDHRFYGDSLYRKIVKRLDQLERHGMPMPFFVPHEDVNRGVTSVSGRRLINFASYNYLGLSGDPEVTRQAKAAIDRYGTSVSASRVVSGEIPLHRELERALARFIGTEDCMLYVGGHATNVATIGHLMGPGDLILHDEHAHNSVLEGCRLSGAARKSFRHNDCAHLERLLEKHRGRHERVLIAIEGVYSMEGDIADLPGILALKQRYDALLMVDEAHSIGVLGARGRGIAEHFGIDPHAVDIWMGTLSKSLASCGGYIAGSARLIEYLKFTSPGFVYSVGMPPASAAAALAALRIIEQQPQRLCALRERAALFLDCARAHGLDTGLSAGTPIVPVITGKALMAGRLAKALFEQGIQAPPIMYPAVKRKAARLRFFIAADHTEEQIRLTAAVAARELSRLNENHPEEEHEHDDALEPH